MAERPLVALAYSGGLDTSYCILWLRERGYDVLPITVDTGGFEKGELAAIAAKAARLGALPHVCVDARHAVYGRFVSYIVKANVLRGGVYPLCVAAERVQQAIEVAKVAKERGAKAVAHGSTGAGNDQIRFDAAFATLLPGIEIITPIREHHVTRKVSAAALRAIGEEVPERTESLSVNVSLWGTTIGGREIHDPWSEPKEDVWKITRSPETALPPVEIALRFESGLPVSLDGTAMDGPALIAKLNEVAGSRGVGRGIHLGDTILGIKGRIAFEAPAPQVLVLAHQELEKLVLTRWQQYWKQTLGSFYGSLLHEGLFFEPVARDIEAFVDRSQGAVSGDVRVKLGFGKATVTGVRAERSLIAPEVAKYGEDNAYWDGRDARGFAKLWALQPAIATWRAGGGT